MTVSKILDPNNDAPGKYKGKTTSNEKKDFFRIFCKKSRKGPSINFVERIKLYH
jgi:hypothetical protein